MQTGLLDQHLHDDERLERFLKKEPMKQLVMVLHLQQEWQVLAPEVMQQQQMVLAQKDVEDLALWCCCRARC